MNLLSTPIIFYSFFYSLVDRCVTKTINYTSKSLVLPSTYLPTYSNLGIIDTSMSQCVFLKNGQITAYFCFIFVLFTFQFLWQIYNLNNINWKKRRWRAWDSNPGGRAGWKAKTNPLSYGGPLSLNVFVFLVFHFVYWPNWMYISFFFVLLVYYVFSYCPLFCLHLSFFHLYLINIQNGFPISFCFPKKAYIPTA